MNDTEIKPSTLAGKYLTFNIGQESYGINVLNVQEIIRLVNITAAPQMPRYVKGVINLRGKVIPAISTGLRLGLAELPYTERTCIVVIHRKSIRLGLIVDGVEEVLNIGEGDIAETRETAETPTSTFVIGTAEIKGVRKKLLNTEAFFEGLGALLHS